MEPQAPAYLSLVIPAFNEDRRIGQSLERILSFFRAQSYPFEIIVVDDDDLEGIGLRAEKAQDALEALPDAAVFVEGGNDERQVRRCLRLH